MRGKGGRDMIDYSLYPYYTPPPVRFIGSIWINKKNGKEYCIMTVLRDWTVGREGSLVVAYSSGDGLQGVREYSEFFNKFYEKPKQSINL